ncbi:Transcriptional regulator FrcR for fructose utilization, ROK family [Rubrivivax sp. A210]|uniref:ROK family transcriptional regulator n=1 Tax=Rubrivivax sp. A210 TaxID=2772301 RepID=UPI0019B36452|nr:ROK family transcriptional regulator [Rubrivivax sp. A210]CAD5372377.1 Transcriptional regulator FrcR for fructose utilization, ROK family [Rubrivivax sp. A210]
MNAAAAHDAPDRKPLQPRGSSQGGLRQYNERVVLQAIRLHGALPGADIARATRLTAQTVSLITKRLLDEGLLRKGEPLRGKVGQPSVPLSLAPDGAYAVGVKVGRRSLDVVLIDFVGKVRQRWSLNYEYADPDALLDEIARRLQDVRQLLGPAAHARVQGVGIAAPLSLGGWQSLLGLPPAVAERWRHFDLEQAVAQVTELPVTLIKDTSAACVAELVAGRGRSVKSFLYVFVDTFIGGGLVLDSHLHGGLSGNAGAIGSLSLWLGRGERASGAPPAQLLSLGSLLTLERAYAAAGLAPDAMADTRALQAPWLVHTEAWLAEAAAAIAQAVQGAACLLDMEGVIIDGNFSRELLATLLGATAQALEGHDWEGVAHPRLLAGTIGSDARALGGALLPLYANFAPDRALFLKLDA